MVGPAHLSLLLLLLSAGSEAQDSCSLFRKEYCSLRLDKIMMLDTALNSPSECQVSHSSQEARKREKFLLLHM